MIHSEDLGLGAVLLVLWVHYLGNLPREGVIPPVQRNLDVFSTVFKNENSSIQSSWII